MPLLLSLSHGRFVQIYPFFGFGSLARRATGVYRKLWGTAGDPQYID